VGIVYGRLKMRFLILGLLVALNFSSEAIAECASPNDVCQHIRYCAVVNLTAANAVDNGRLQAALAREDGNEIYSATEACQRNVGDINAFKSQSAGCTSHDYQMVGMSLRAAGWTCGKRARYFCNTQSQFFPLDGLQCKGTERQGRSLFLQCVWSKQSWNGEGLCDRLVSRPPAQSTGSHH
jgi:hypothetical protein